MGDVFCSYRTGLFISFMIDTVVLGDLHFLWWGIRQGFIWYPFNRIQELRKRNREIGSEGSITIFGGFLVFAVFVVFCCKGRFFQKG